MRSIRFFALLVVVGACLWLIPHVASGQQPSASYQLFYDELSPYGSWIEYPRYGYVWIPEGNPGFIPYESDGHWILTDDGWTWVSDYSWGWAPFHYGRWDFDNSYGWFWVPDDEWGPAWVSWRRSPGYFGWAPLRPGISVTMSFANGYHEQNERWAFVRDRDITRQDVGHYYVNRNNNGTILNSSTMIVNARRDESRGGTYIVGPGRDDVQKATNATVNVVAIRDNKKPGQRLTSGELSIYKPQVQKRNGNGNVPVPAKLVNANDVKPASRRIDGARGQQPAAATVPNQTLPSQAQGANPSGNRARMQQQQAAAPPTAPQPQQRADQHQQRVAQQQQRDVQQQQQRVAQQQQRDGQQQQQRVAQQQQRDAQQQQRITQQSQQRLAHQQQRDAQQQQQRATQQQQRPTQQQQRAAQQPQQRAAQQPQQRAAQQPQQRAAQQPQQRPPQQRGPSLPTPKGNDMQPQDVSPAKESQALAPLSVNPSHERGSEKQQLKITQPKKIEDPQTKVNQDEKDKKHE